MIATESEAWAEPGGPDVRGLAEEVRRLRRELHVARELNARLRRLATCDDLTGLRNRRFLRTALEACLRWAARGGSSATVALLDLDHFKSFNDAHGHPAGDEVLREVAYRLRVTGPRGGIIARHGGEEFAVLMPGADEEDGRLYAERMRRYIERGEWPLRLITASVGVATWRPGDGDARDLLGRADAALYRSKRDGRNRVIHDRDA